MDVGIDRGADDTAAFELDSGLAGPPEDEEEKDDISDAMHTVRRLILIATIWVLVQINAYGWNWYAAAPRRLLNWST